MTLWNEIPLKYALFGSYSDVCSALEKLWNMRSSSAIQCVTETIVDILNNAAHVWELDIYHTICGQELVKTRLINIRSNDQFIAKWDPVISELVELDSPSVGSPRQAKAVRRELVHDFQAALCQSPLVHGSWYVSRFLCGWLKFAVIKSYFLLSKHMSNIESKCSDIRADSQSHARDFILAFVWEMRAALWRKLCKWHDVAQFRNVAQSMFGILT